MSIVRKRCLYNKTFNLQCEKNYFDLIRIFYNYDFIFNFTEVILLNLFQVLHRRFVERSFNRVEKELFPINEYQS